MSFKKSLETQITCICAVFIFLQFLFLFLWWLESDDVSDVLPWAGFLAFLSYDLMVMTLGISIAFYFRSTFRDGMAHNEARLLVDCCDILGLFQETTWYYYYQLSKSRWTGSRVWSLDILFFLYTDRAVVRALGWSQVAYQRFGKTKTGGGGCGRVKKKKGGCRVWKDEERVELMGCTACSGKHRNTIMSGV